MKALTMKRYAMMLAAFLPIGLVGITYPRFRRAMRCDREQLLPDQQFHPQDSFD